MKTNKALLFLGLTSLFCTNAEAAMEFYDLCSACYSGTLEHVQERITRGDDVNALGHIRGMGRTPLRIMLSYNRARFQEDRINIIRELLSQLNIDVNKEDSDGETAFNRVTLNAAMLAGTLDQEDAAQLCLEFLRVGHLISNENLEQAQADLESIIDFDKINYDVEVERGSVVDLYQRITHILYTRKKSKRDQIYSNQDPQERVAFERENYGTFPVTINNTLISIPMANILLQN